jgi:hypothetical protein
MTTEQWGPYIWKLFHVLAGNMKEESFQTIGRELLSFIKRICANLPCPDCSRHATFFFK